MGGGSWSDTDYRRSARGRDAFRYSDDTLSKPRGEQRCHQLLNPCNLKVRESRDSAEHPESNAVMIGLDVTGSMGAVVVAIQNSLGNLMDMLLKGEYIPHPQVLFYAVGDATCDAIPFQVSQFESDNRINDQLTKVILEGNGGGHITESYELGFYCAARHTSIDCHEKRNKKGYLFSIGDETPYSGVKKSEVKKIFGAELQDGISLSQIVKEVREKYNIFHIIPRGSSHYTDPEIRNIWIDLLGGRQFVFMLENPTATAETIALAIGINEGNITLEEGIKIIVKKSGQEIATAVRKALEEFAAYIGTKPKRASAAKKETKTDSKTKKKDWKL